ncbi:glycoside hydrolase family 65 protein [Rhodopila globiformis]|uniref:Family 65 glycosyl hydrolase n=1 Tax=Rhodopila globiformis TaxID=1071 RepID=A0A2S6NFU8_RHOGL|nr:glycosyl hydrolase family 65 protein [Rhodopila globiformis]PPQ33486.1 family 65 glycosyl hydrolase [Rhodopila globiformis]
MTGPEMKAGIPGPGADPGWTFCLDGYDPLLENSVESRFAISNGFLGIRGARATSRGQRWIVPARTYVAGLFDTSGTEHATTGLVPAADWLRFRIMMAGGPLLHHPGDMSSHHMTLDVRQGALFSAGRHFDSPDLGIQVRTLRLASISDRALGLQLIQMEIEQGEVDVAVEASFEGVELGLVIDRLDQDLGTWRTRHSGKRLAMATTSSLQIDGRDLEPAARGPLTWSWNWKTRPGQIATFQRFVAVVRSDAPDLDPGPEARDKLGSARHVGWQDVVAAHKAAWGRRWHNSDVEVDGDAKAQRMLRFALYHLNGAANPADERVSIGARALTGDNYHGHVFWDTEIFLLPFYILTWPEAARTLLMYRFHLLNGARAKAAAMGWRGALYPWESADTGADVTPEQVIGPDHRVIAILCGKLEQHISADVAYAVWQYWQATGDDAFLLEAGAEILLETGRFWASRAQREADGRCHIRGVIGPDEYHEHVDDNAYTNVMARWNIRRALDIAALLREHWPVRWISLARHLGLEDAELAQWLDVAETIAIGRDPETGLFEQFSGYFALEDIDLSHYAGRSVPMDVVLGRERTQASQVVKQSDVVALLGLLPEEFAGAAAETNFRYYEPRCSHGSSLSPAMHGLVAARLGDAEMALRYLRQTAAIDLAETHVAADGGIHIAALGGIWMLAVFGFAGLTLRNDGIAIDPRLPAGWDSMVFRIQWRGRHLKIAIDQANQSVEATLEAGEPMALTVGGDPHPLGRAAMLAVRFRKPGAASC